MGNDSVLNPATALHEKLKAALDSATCELPPRELFETYQNALVTKHDRDHMQESLHDWNQQYEDATADAEAGFEDFEDAGQAFVSEMLDRTRQLPGQQEA